MAFVAGLNTMGFAMAGLYFLRFWRQTRDAFFIWFAAAFWLLSANYAIEGFLNFGPGSIFRYVLRVIGFALIIFGVFSKNLGSGRSTRA